MAYLSYILLISSVVAVRSAVHIKVGIYNYIPDLNKDGLEAYKQMIQDDFKLYCETTLAIEDCSVDAVVDFSVYDPYGDLTDYLEHQGFDILETDIGYNLDQLVESGSVMPILSIDESLVSYIEDNMFPSAVQAVTVSNAEESIIYALPTLLCGNFITSIDPATLEACPIALGTAPYPAYKLGVDKCRANMADTYSTLIMGKMYNGKGGYLPDIYLDGYMDIHGKGSLNTAMEDLLNGIVDDTLCERLQWFIGQCIVESPETNKCNGEFGGDEYDETIYEQILQNKNLLMFSFSEKLSQLLQRADEAGSVRKPYGIASVSFGDLENNLLQYVDGLVTGKTQWEDANDLKKSVITAFNRFFIETTYREKVTTGAYLPQPTNTYLIIPSTAFYGNENLDTIYKQMLPFLNSAVPAPYISSVDRETMLNTLTTTCVPGYFPPPGEKKQKENKTEL